MTLSEIQRIVTRFKKVLRDEDVPFVGMYLFGSYAKGNPHRDSDVDVAIVVPSRTTKLLQKQTSHIPWLAKQVHVKLEPHVLTDQELNNPWLTLPVELKRYGKKLR